jgi:hypothetical protein
MSALNNEFNWTDKVSLQHYFEKLMDTLTTANNKRFDDLEEKMDLHFKLNAEALNKAETATNIRLENMNEFRSSLRDQQANFLTRGEYDSKHEALLAKIESLQKITYTIMGGLALLEIILRFIK